jgi:hypothetical protein
MGGNKGRLLNGLDAALIERGEAGGLAHAHFRWRAALVYRGANGAVAFLMQGP